MMVIIGPGLHHHHFNWQHLGAHKLEPHDMFCSLSCRRKQRISKECSKSNISKFFQNKFKNLALNPLSFRSFSVWLMHGTCRFVARFSSHSDPSPSQESYCRHLCERMMTPTPTFQTHRKHPIHTHLRPLVAVRPWSASRYTLMPAYLTPHKNHEYNSSWRYQSWIANTNGPSCEEQSRWIVASLT